MGFWSLNHLMDGLGFPEAWQGKTAIVLIGRVWLAGPMAMIGFFYETDWLTLDSDLSHESSWDNNHSWAKFKIVLVRKPKRKFSCVLYGKILRYWFFLPIFESKFQGSGFSFKFWIQFFKVVVFPSIFWNTTMIWQVLRVVLNFSLECYYFKNKVGVLDFTKARGLVKFQSPRALTKSQLFSHKWS